VKYNSSGAQIDQFPAGAEQNVEHPSMGQVDGVSHSGERFETAPGENSAGNTAVVGDTQPNQ